MATVLWLSQSNGLANKVDPTRIQYQEGTGVAHLAEAYNVDFDITGAISRRLGFTATDITASCHSFFFGGGECVFVSANSLCLLGSDLTATAIRAVDGNKRMSYCQVGDSILYMNGAQKGVIKAGASWEYERPTDPRYPDSTRNYDDPPVGTIVRVHSSRVYIADGSVLWYSEPFAPNLFRRAANFIPFAAKITMVAPVAAGLVVSTAYRLYFLAGKNPKEFTLASLAGYPAIEGTDVEVDGIALEGGKYGMQPMQMFTTTKGICAVSSEGQFVNLTHQTIEYPKSNRGAAVFTGKRYIVSLEA